MAHFSSFAVSLMLLSGLVVAAKDRKKIVLPTDVLRARTVLVLVDPDAAMTIQDPNANRAARDDVEKALIRWGRFTQAPDASNADLIITVRKGNGKMAQPTVGACQSTIVRWCCNLPIQAAGWAAGWGIRPTSAIRPAPKIRRKVRIRRPKSVRGWTCLRSIGEASMPRSTIRRCGVIPRKMHCNRPECRRLRNSRRSSPRRKKNKLPNNERTPR